MQLDLFQPAVEYDRTQPSCLWNPKTFDWENCFSYFVNYDYWGNDKNWILRDYRETFWKLTGVCIAIYVLDGGID